MNGLQLANFVPEIREMAAKDMAEAAEGINIWTFRMRTKTNPEMITLARISNTFARSLKHWNSQTPKHQKQSVRESFMIKYGLIYCEKLDCYIPLTKMDLFLNFLKTLKNV